MQEQEKTVKIHLNHITCGLIIAGVLILGFEHKTSIDKEVSTQLTQYLPPPPPLPTPTPTPPPPTCRDLGGCGTSGGADIPWLTVQTLPPPLPPPYPKPTPTPTPDGPCTPVMPECRKDLGL